MIAGMPTFDITRGPVGTGVKSGFSLSLPAGVMK
jgi:hypothetical protein